MVDDTTHKLSTAIKNLQHDVRRLLSGRWLENSSIRNGKLRFIGGVLRLDSGALLDLVGQWRLKGPGAITGDVVAEGKWTQNGDWEFNGDGDLAGDADLSGNFNLTGVLDADGVRIEDGKVIVEGVDGDLVWTDSKGTFANGAEIRAPGNSGIRITYGTTNVFLDGTSAIITAGNRRIIVSATGFQFFNIPTKTPAATGLTSGAAHLDASGNLFRVS